MAYCCPNCGSRDIFALKKAIALAKVYLRFSFWLYWQPI